MPYKSKETAKKYFAEHAKKNRPIRNKQNKNWRNKNKEYCNNYGKEYRKKNAAIIKKKKREYVLKKTYGLSLKDYDDMYKEQKGRCFICKKHQNELNRLLNIDHCHKTNKIRKLLCHMCNLAVGFYENYDIKIIEEYVNNHKRKDVN